MIKIVTDSSADITQEQARQLGITVLPLAINFGSEILLDGVEILPDEFYQRLSSSKTVPTTSQATPFQFEEIFSKARDDGDTVILLPISRKLSGSHACAEMVKSQGSFQNVFIVDTLATVGKLKQIVLEALKMKDAMPPQQLVSYLENFRERVKLYAMIDTLEYLYKGGRVSRASATIGSLLSVKPIISVINGEVKVVGKGMGAKKGVSIVADYFKNADIDFERPVLFVYADKKERCTELIERCISDSELRKNYIADMQNLSPIVGVHTGANVACVVYVERTKNS